jgi:hypothetical protein
MPSRRREAVVLGLVGAACIAVSLAITVAMPHASVALLIGAAAGLVGIYVLMTNPRLEVTVALLVVYLGLLDGPVKLGTGGHEAASVVRDVLIFAVVAGAVLRLVVGRVEFKLPPLSGWVLLFVAIVLVETLNPPNTHGFVKALGGYRQQLEFVPFFFFGYALMRSKERFRKAFLILGVIALANGIVSAYQTKISTAQLASWGPGYAELVHGSTTVEEGKKRGLSARAYTTGEGGPARVRPPGLGKDAGFSGGVGAIALPCLLAAIAVTKGRRRAIFMLLCLGALLGVITGLGRSQVVGAVLSVIVFGVLSAGAGRQLRRPLLAVIGVLMLAVPLGVALVSAEAPGTFNRYAEIAPGSVAGAKDKKTGDLENLPHQLSVAPFGLGLGTTGAASGFGGNFSEEQAPGTGHGETLYSYLANEVGLPGLILWVSFAVYLILLAFRRVRFIADPELRLLVTGMFSALTAFFLIGVSAPVMGSSAYAAFFWFTAGVAAYWLVPRRSPRAIPSVAVPQQA